MKNLNHFFCGVTSLTAAALLVTGCSTNFNPTFSGSTSVAGSALRGNLMGGQQPIVGAKIYLMAAGTAQGDAGYGTASTSLLTSPGYVTTSTTGGFTITGDYTCPQQNTQVYLLSEGGNPGAGVNSAAILMLALGNCGDLSASTYLIMNELTTVAAVTALQQFISGPMAIGSSTGNTPGMQSAFLTAKLLVNINNGVPSSGNSTITYPEAKIYTLGDAMAACVNSAGAGSGSCTAFFTGAVDEANPGTPPADTFQAMLNIARYPAADPGDVFLAVPSTGASYGGALASAPHDFSLPIVYSGGGLKNAAGSSATSIAIDGNGNAWVSVCGASCNSGATQPDDLVLIQPGNGSYGNGFIGSGAGVGMGSVHYVQGLAIDESNYMWATSDPTPNGFTQPSNNTANISIFSPDTTELGAPFTDGTNFSLPQGIAIDTSNNAWIADSGNLNVFSVDITGTVTHPLTLTTALTAPTGIALDSNGNVIVTDKGSTANSTAGGVAIFTPGTGTGGTYGETYSVAGATHPTVVAVDSTHHIWELDPTTNKIHRLTGTGASSPTGAFAGGAGVAVPNATSITSFTLDGTGQAIVPACSAGCSGGSADSVAFISNAGVVVTGRSGLQDSSLSKPAGVAVDPSGNTWVANAGTGAVTEFIGIATPVQTPLSAALSSATLATRP